MGNNKGYKRRNYFIDKSFQSKFIFKFCLIVIIASLVIGGLLFYYSQGSTTVAIENTKVQVKNTSDFILPLMIDTIFIVAGAAALVMALLTLLVSHQIAGPLYRINREINGLKEGGLKRNFNLRSNDQLQNLAKNLNDMCGVLKEKISAAKVNMSYLDDFLQKNKDNLSEEDKEKLEDLLKDNKENLSFFES